MSLTSRIKEWYQRDIITQKIDHIDVVDPTTHTNPKWENFIWYNKKAGRIWICIKNTKDANVWRSTDGQLIAPTTVTKFDIFEDKSAIALYTFDKSLKDIGGQYNLKPTQDRYVRYTEGKYGYSVLSYYNSLQLSTKIPELKQLNVVTVSAWIKWNGWCCVMPFGFKSLDFYFCCNWAGINTGHGDIYGNKVDELGLAAHVWVHLVVEFHNGEYGRFWVNGKEATYKYWSSNYGSTAKITEDFHIFGWGNNNSYRHFGAVDQVRIFNRALTLDEINYLYHEVG